MNQSRRNFLKTTCLGIITGPALTAKIASAKNTKKPNIILIVADDMGYSDAQCYGGEIRTPNLSKLAANGVRFTQHYSCGRCWPSRASILSGYYAPHIRRDNLDEIKTGKRPVWAKLLPEMLKPLGYRSYHSGKWHIDGTPIEAGFDRSWGREHSSCDWDRFFDSKPWQEDDLKAPVKQGESYYSTVGIADHAIACLKLHKRNTPDKPFFQYITFYSPHFPLHALQKDIDQYKDTYTEGWDVIRQHRWERMKKMGIINCELSPRDTDIYPHWNMKPKALKEKISAGEVGKAVAWDTLNDKQKKFQAHKMAIHAAMITRMDTEIGRIIDQLKEMKVYDNSIIFFVSDNGASAEQFIRGDGHDPSEPMGSAKTFLCLAPGWSTAANTPFRLHKHWNHEGGISSPLIVHWPMGIKAAGELRTDPSHFIDFVPTALELAGACCAMLPAGAPKRPGKSLVPAFAKDGAVKHEYLWWAHEHNRAIRHGKWKLTARRIKGNKTGPWKLYDLSFDRCEQNNLAEKHPDIVVKLNKKWQEIAENCKTNI